MAWSTVMDHAPIYQSTERRGTRAPFSSLRRGGSLVSAAVALTVSGIALGYHGLPAPASDAPSSGDTQPAAISVPVPMVALPRIERGHPDLVAQISSAIIQRIQQVQNPPPLALVLPAVQPVLGPAVVVESPPAFTAPVIVPVDIAPVEDAAPSDEDSASVDAAAPLRQVVAPVAPRTFAASSVVEVAAEQVEASAPAEDAPAAEEAPAP